MYWLLDPQRQAQVRAQVEALVGELSQITGNPQTDQLFPFVGRKDRRKAAAVVRHLSPPGGRVVEPFAGSGVIAYAIAGNERELLANEWEPYANRMAGAPWNLPDLAGLKAAYDAVINRVSGPLRALYATVCSCGTPHVIDSLFFDREPLSFSNVTTHERLGAAGENVTYRTGRRCPHCKATQKPFDASDRATLDAVEAMPEPAIFNAPLIENSRINLSAAFTRYGSLFPHRSRVALGILWQAIQDEPRPVPRRFLEDVFLSLIPQAKYRDYRGKSQDLHCPPVQLREVNLLYRFQEQYEKRRDGLYGYRLAPVLRAGEPPRPPLACEDFRAFLGSIPAASADLVVTDPPWGDANPYFEKAQLYHPWLGYSLAADARRLAKEWVITDAPSRREHDRDRWWADADDFFGASARVLKPCGYLALYFRPAPPSEWLANLNRIKLVARRNGYEPLLSVDVGSSDPSMRMQQSASYVFAGDVVMLFLRLPDAIRRTFWDGHDIDHLAYSTAETLQEAARGPFSRKQWLAAMAAGLLGMGLGMYTAPRYDAALAALLARYCDEVSPGAFLAKADTPFSGQLFDTPAVERLFTYVPLVVRQLARGGATFTYDQFLLSLATFVENGTRMLIHQVEQLDLRRMLDTYAEAVGEGGRFRRRPLPPIPAAVANVMEMDPYVFEGFIADLLVRQGCTDVALVGRAGDRGVDISCRDRDGRPTVVQCKRWISNVGSTPIQRLHSFAVTRGAERMICVTTSDFTPDGVHEAEVTGTELVNGAELARLIAIHMPELLAQPA